MELFWKTTGTHRPEIANLFPCHDYGIIVFMLFHFMNSTSRIWIEQIQPTCCHLNAFISFNTFFPFWKNLTVIINETDLPLEFQRYSFYRSLGQMFQSKGQPGISITTRFWVLKCIAKSGSRSLGNMAG